jgi:hypothetical protein
MQVIVSDHLKEECSSSDPERKSQLMLIKEINMNQKKSKQKSSKTETTVQSNQAKPSLPKVAAGVAAASGATLIAITMIGVAPAILAGAAGYFAYCGMTDQKTERAV